MTVSDLTPPARPPTETPSIGLRLGLLPRTVGRNIREKPAQSAGLCFSRQERLLFPSDRMILKVKLYLSGQKTLLTPSGTAVRRDSTIHEARQLREAGWLLGPSIEGEYSTPCLAY